MRRSFSLLLTVLLLLTMIPAAGAEGANLPVLQNLRTNGRIDPLGVDTPAPEFSWQMSSTVRQSTQENYRLVVKDEEGAVVWDSGTVESAASVGILYEGAALLPARVYSWQVTVTDNNGNEIVSPVAKFETSLMDTTFDAWGGAQFIGSDVLPLDAASKAVFRISADVLLAEGSDTASFVLGADDFRLKNRAFNPWLSEGENYVRLELDFTEATDEGGVKINAYRCGYGEEDPMVPFAVVSEKPELDALLSRKNQHDVHRISILCSASTLSLSVDGTELPAPCSIVVSPLGSAVNTYPNLNSVGFAARAGESAVFSDYTIENAGKYARGTLFGKDAGAGYEIFAGLDGITVDGGSIIVDGGEKGVLSYADPSFGASPMLRTAFSTLEGIRKARLYLTAHGIYNFYLNGQEVAPEEWFNPGSTEYDALLAYNVYDVTDMIREGENAMGAVLGEGWWTGMTTFECLNNNYYGDAPALMAKLVVSYSDGSQQTLVTNADSWTVYDDGPVRSASFFQGERYDATKETAVSGWTEPGYNASAWRPASVSETRKQFSSPRLITRYDEPVHVIRTVSAVSALGETKEGSGSFLYDMGENVSGVPLITIPAELAEPGETVTVRFAEIRYPDLEEYTEAGVNGLLMVENYRTALATDFYTMKEGENIFAPDLTFHGYRYIEISGLDKPLPTECVQMQVLSSLDASASYESSNPLADQLFRNIVNSTTSNYISLPTDCPQRDERMGWTGDAQVFALSGSYVADTCNFMRQWMETVRADCGPTGLSSQYCPAFVNYDLEADETITHKGQSFGITWNCLVVTIPYNLYLQTGDPAILRDNIENIYTYVDHLIETPLKYKDANGDKQTDDRLTGETGTLCDHLARVPTDGVSLGNAVYIACLDEAAVMADALGDAEKAEHYRTTAAAAREAWNELFIDAETGMTKNAKGVIQNTQASYATPLRFGVISEENLPRALEHYQNTISDPDHTDGDGLEVPPYTITTGFNATGNVLNALSENGLNEMAYRLFESTEYASWLYPVTQGATSIWERWNGFTSELGFNGNNSMNSFNHYSFGAVFEWMMAYQLGICADPSNPGYQHFILQPVPGGSSADPESGLTYARGSFDSPYGTIQSGWVVKDSKIIEYNAQIPANASATLYLPVTGDVRADEAARVVGTVGHNGVECTQIELPSGSWHFAIGSGEIEITDGTVL